MKHFLLFVLSIFLYAGLFAQGKVVFKKPDKTDMGDTLKIEHDISETDLPDYFEIDGYISNVSTGSVTIAIRRVVVKYMAISVKNMNNTSDQICWGKDCRNYKPTQLDLTTGDSLLNSGEDAALINNGFVVFHYKHSGAIGSTIIKYYLMNGQTIEDSLIAVYTLTGTKVTLNLNLDISTLNGFDPVDNKVYVKGTFLDDSVQMASWDSINYFISVPAGLDAGYTYHYSTKSGDVSVEKPLTVLSSDITVNDEFSTVGIGQRKAQAMISVYPNPAAESTLVNYQLSGKGAAKLVLVNILGKMVTEMNLVNPNNTVELKLNGVPAGIYFVNIVQSGQVLSSRKLIKK
jgi:hypothetical protein